MLTASCASPSCRRPSSPGSHPSSACKAGSMSMGGQGIAMSAQESKYEFDLSLVLSRSLSFSLSLVLSRSLSLSRSVSFSLFLSCSLLFSLVLSRAISFALSLSLSLARSLRSVCFSFSFSSLCLSLLSYHQNYSLCSYRFWQGPIVLQSSARLIGATQLLTVAHIHISNLSIYLSSLNLSILTLT